MEAEVPLLHDSEVDSIQDPGVPDPDVEMLLARSGQQSGINFGERWNLIRLRYARGLIEYHGQVYLHVVLVWQNVARR